MTSVDDTYIRVIVREAYERRDYPAVLELLMQMSAEQIQGEAELGLMKAVSLFRTGRYAEALRGAEDLAPASIASGNPRIERRRENLIANVYLAIGRHADAIPLWRSLLQASLIDRDYQIAAWCCQNLGAAADFSCRFDEALAYHLRALAMYQRLGDWRGVGGTHVNIAITYFQLARYGEARSNIDQAFQYIRRANARTEEASCELQLARIALADGDTELATAAGLRAHQFFNTMDDLAGIAEALLVVGMSAREAGRVDDALRMISEALDHSRTAGKKILEGEILAQFSLSMMRQGNEDAARAYETDARALFQEIGANARADLVFGGQKIAAKQ